MQLTSQRENQGIQWILLNIRNFTASTTSAIAFTRDHEILLLSRNRLVHARRLCIPLSLYRGPSTAVLLLVTVFASYMPLAPLKIARDLASNGSSCLIYLSFSVRYLARLRASQANRCWVLIPNHQSVKTSPHAWRVNYSFSLSTLFAFSRCRSAQLVAHYLKEDIINFRSFLIRTSTRTQWLRTLPYLLLAVSLHDASC